MPARALAPATVSQTYAELRRSVEDALLTGQRNIEQAKVRTYHETGRLIREHLLANRDRADYGTKLFVRLSEDLDVDRSVLQRCDQFYRAFPNCATWHNLTWAHFRVLLPIEDARQRRALATEADRNEWAVAQLEERVRTLFPINVTPDSDESNPATPPAVTLLKPKRGTPGFYPVVTHADTPSLDLGFKFYLPLDHLPGTPLRSLTAGDLVRVDDDRVPIPAPDATKADLYTFRTLAVRVVDGDTLAVTIDLPPFNRVDKKLRLRGLNCPEMDTAAGKAAKRYVQSLVDRATEVIITTTKPDKYDRYLADVFLVGLSDQSAGASAKEDNGLPLSALTSALFLNNALLAHGHAVNMGDSAQPVVS